MGWSGNSLSENPEKRQLLYSRMNENNLRVIWGVELAELED